MDIATLIGFVGGTVLFIWATTADGGSIMDFVNVPSILITVGGTIAATLINFSLKPLVGLVMVLRHAFADKSPDARATIGALVGFAERARREGLLALEDEINQLDDPCMKKGLQLVVDGTDPELVRSIMETELAFLEDRHKAGAQVFDQMAVYAPAFGMVGTAGRRVGDARATAETQSGGDPQSRSQSQPVGVSLCTAQAGGGVHRCRRRCGPGASGCRGVRTGAPAGHHPLLGPGPA